MEQEGSMDDRFIQRLIEIIAANLENERFGVRELAENAGISRSQLHRKLHAINGKSPSRFIREYRLERAMEMLKDNVTTASEVAYRVGFGSPAYFSTCFKERYGYPPGEVKYRTSDVDSPEQTNNADTPKIDDLNKTGRSTYKWALPLVLLVLGGLIFYYFSTASAKDGAKAKEGKPIASTVSIAVLPLKDLSDDTGNQYFGEGVAESIQDHLNKIEGLKVISQTSVAKYRDTQMTTPQIAEELRVSHLLESSVQKSGDKVRVVAKLIDAKNDQQLWSDTYDRELTDIFNIQSDIAKQIARELKLALSAKTVAQIEKIPTKNMEAYNLYKKGLYFDSFRVHSRSHKEGETSVNYFKKAIEKDPNFSEAYSALAAAELFAGKNLYVLDSVEYVKKLALKALELNNDNSEAHTVLGRLACFYEWDWETAEREYKKALELNPNNSTAHLSYSNFTYYVKGEFEKAMELGKKAMELDPLSLDALISMGYYYINKGDTKKALEIANKMKEIKKDNIFPYFIAFEALLKEGRDGEAISELEEIFSIHARDNEVMKVYAVDDIVNAFNKGGEKELNRYFVEKNRQIYGSPDNLDDFILYSDAGFLAFNGEYDRALEYLELAYNRRIIGLYTIKHNPELINLRENPRFLALLDKMNLGGYQ